MSVWADTARLGTCESCTVLIYKSSLFFFLSTLKSLVVMAITPAVSTISERSADFKYVYGKRKLQYRHFRRIWVRKTLEVFAPYLRLCYKPGFLKIIFKMNLCYLVKKGHHFFKSPSSPPKLQILFNNDVKIFVLSSLFRGCRHLLITLPLSKHFIS